MTSWQSEVLINSPYATARRGSEITFSCNKFYKGRRVSWLRRLLTPRTKVDKVLASQHRAFPLFRFVLNTLAWRSCARAQRTELILRWKGIHSLSVGTLLTFAIIISARLFLLISFCPDFSRKVLLVVFGVLFFMVSLYCFTWLCVLFYNSQLAPHLARWHGAAKSRRRHQLHCGETY